MSTNTGLMENLTKSAKAAMRSASLEASKSYVWHNNEFVGMESWDTDKNMLVELFTGKRTGTKILVHYDDVNPSKMLTFEEEFEQALSFKAEAPGLEFHDEYPEYQAKDLDLAEGVFSVENVVFLSKKGEGYVNNMFGDSTQLPTSGLGWIIAFNVLKKYLTIEDDHLRHKILDLCIALVFTPAVIVLTGKTKNGDVVLNANGKPRAAPQDAVMNMLVRHPLDKIPNARKFWGKSAMVNVSCLQKVGLIVLCCDPMCANQVAIQRSHFDGKKLHEINIDTNTFGTMNLETIRIIRLAANEAKVFHDSNPKRFEELKV